MTEPAASGIRASGSSSVLRGPLFQLTVIVVAGASADYANSTVGPLQETMRFALGLSDNQVGILQGPALNLPPVLAGVPLGLLIDRYSRARLLVIFTALELLGTVLTAVAPNLSILLCARALIGSMLAANGANAAVLVAEFVAPTRRGRTLMLLGVAQVAGMSAAFGLGGKVVAMYGADPSAWRWAMLWLAVPLSVVFVLTFWVREPTHRICDRQTPGWREAMAGLWRYRAMFIPLSFGQVIFSMGYAGALVWSAPILARQFGLEPDRIGALMGSVLFGSGLVGMLSGGILTDLCQRTGGLKRTVSFMIFLALLQIPVAFYAIIPGVFWLVLLLATMYTIAFIKAIVVSAAMTIAIPTEFLGLAFGVMGAINAIFGSLSPVVVSELAGQIGGVASIGKAITVVCSLTTVMAAVIFAIGRQHFPGKNLAERSLTSLSAVTPH